MAPRTTSTGTKPWPRATGSRLPVRRHQNSETTRREAPLGGPIWKNHTFFFMNYEQQNYRQALTAPGTTPSARLGLRSHRSNGQRWRASKSARSDADQYSLAGQ